MKLETISEIDFIKNNLKILSYAEIAEKLNRGYDVIKHKIKSLGLVEYEMGKNPNSRKKKIYSCNHQSFRLLNEDVCYWVGFIAADGSIGKDLNTVSFCLASRDKDHLIAFNEFIESDKIILEGQAKYKYKNIESFKSYASLTILSPLIVDDLKNNFNIVNKKSLILEPPHLTDRAHIDAYIKGYIDGDGTVALKNSKNGKVLYITALGTKAVMSWIAKRFGEILDCGVEVYTKKNLSTILLSHRKARRLFLHFYKISNYGLDRKWSSENLNHCLDFRKKPKTKNYELKNKIIDMRKTMSAVEIANKLEISVNNVYFHLKN